MKKLFFGALLVLNTSYAAVTTTPSSTTTKPSTYNPPANTPLAPLVPSITPTTKGHAPLKGKDAHAAKIKGEEETTATPKTVSFNLPGIIGLEDGKWRGMDHLLNLSNEIYVEANIMSSKDVHLTFNEQDVVSHVTAKLIKAGLNSNKTPPIKPNDAPLPYLNVLIMIQNCGEENGAFIQIRLFEKANLDRVALPKEIFFQAITWEDENFLVMETSQLQKDVFDQIDDMIGYFVERYNFFEKEAMRMKSK